MANKIFKISSRNLTRQKRRNVILAVAIAFGFFVVTMIDGLTTGMVSNLEEQITQLVGGTVLIQGFEKNPPVYEGGKSRLVNIVRDRDYMIDLVKESKINYEYYSCSTSASGTMLFNGKKTLIQVSGRDFSEKEFRESFQLVSGSLDNMTNPNAIIISDKTAESMNLEVGDEIVFTATNIYGQNNVADYTIGAVMKSNTFINSMQAYIDIDVLNDFMGIPEGGYSTFAIYLKNKKESSKAANKIEQIIREDGQNVSSRIDAFLSNPKNPSKGIEKQFKGEENQWEGVKYAVETLDDVIPSIKTVLSVVHMVSTVILLVILLIVMVGVSNTYRMVLYERINEIGTMRALGMSGKDTGKLFTTEAVILCLIGAVAGLLLAVTSMSIIHLIPVKDEALSFFLDNGHFSFTVSVGSVIFQYILLILLTTLAVHGSAKKASRLNPAEALRTVK